MSTVRARCTLCFGAIYTDAGIGAIARAANAPVCCGESLVAPGKAIPQLPMQRTTGLEASCQAHRETMRVHDGENIHHHVDVLSAQLRYSVLARMLSRRALCQSVSSMTAERAS
jgi:hypothetical protein